MRYLRDCEKKNMYKIDKLGWIFAKHLNSMLKILLLVIIMDMILVYVLSKKHFDIKTSSIIAIIYSIIAITLFGLLYLGNKVFIDIEKDKIGCTDVTLKEKREKVNKEQNTKTYYVTLNIDGKSKEVEYKGREFNSLNVNNKMVLIEYKFLNKQEYMCFSHDELNKF